MPRFSILIPSYNRPEYLGQAVASVLASTWRDFELVVSDDCSPRAKEVAAALTPFGGDERLRFVAQSVNLGEAKNRHYLMQAARAPHCIILGDDDLLRPEALATLEAAMREAPGYDLYLFGYAVIDEHGRTVETRRALAPVALDREHPAVVRDLLCADLHPFWLYHPATFCFRANLHAEIVPNAGIGIGDDLIFLDEAVLDGKKALVLPEVLFSYRKFLGGEYQQKNLSQGRLANVMTRRHILYVLESRHDWPEHFLRFIHSREFRTRFLYRPLLLDPDMQEAMLAALELAPEHLREARSLWRRRGPWTGPWLQLGRVLRYARYFGIPGLLEVLRIFRERRAYHRVS